MTAKLSNMEAEMTYSLVSRNTTTTTTRVKIELTSRLSSLLTGITATKKANLVKGKFGIYIEEIPCHCFNKALDSTAQETLQSHASMHPSAKHARLLTRVHLFKEVAYK